jgi:hypothetical protein
MLVIELVLVIGGEEVKRPRTRVHDLLEGQVCASHTARYHFGKRLLHVGPRGGDVEWELERVAR